MLTSFVEYTVLGDRFCIINVERKISMLRVDYLLDNILEDLQFVSCLLERQIMMQSSHLDKM